MPRLISNSDFLFDGVDLVDRPWFPYSCTEVAYWQWKSGGEGHFNFWFVLAGDGYLSCGGETFRIRPGIFFIFPPGQAITGAHYSGPRITRFSAHFHPVKAGRRLESLGESGALWGEVPCLSAIKRRIDAIMRIALRREDDRILAQQLHRLIIESCGEADVVTDVMVHPRVAEAIRVFREAPASVKRIDDFARKLGVSRSHFDREFREQVGQAPKQFLINCKIIEARRYLESSRLRVSEIADKLGYKDIYFFSRQFKHYSGLSPVNYRQSFESE